MAVSQPHLSCPHLAEEPALCRTLLCPEARATLLFQVGGVGQPQQRLQAPHPGLGLCKAPQIFALSKCLVRLRPDLTLNPAGFSLFCNTCRLSSGCFRNFALCTHMMAFLTSNHPAKTNSRHRALAQGQLVALWCPRDSCLNLRTVKHVPRFGACGFAGCWGRERWGVPYVQTGAGGWSLVQMAPGGQEKCTSVKQ